MGDTKRFFIFSVLHNISQKISGLHFLDWMSGYDLQPLHQCLVLFRCDLQCFFFCAGPAEAAKFQPFIEEKKSVSFPYEPLDAVTASSAKQEEDILFIWIQLEVKLHNRCQPVNSSPQIRIAALSTHKDNVAYKHEIFILIFLPKALFKAFL